MKNKKMRIHSGNTDMIWKNLVTGFFSLAVLSLNLGMVYSLKRSGAASVYDRLGYFPAVLFFVLGLGRGLLAFFSRREGRMVILKHMAYVVLCVTGGLILLIRGNGEGSFRAAGILYFSALLISRISAVIHNRSKENILLLCVLLFLFIISMAKPFTTSVLLMDIQAVGYIILIAFSKIKIKILLKIIRQTYAFEILLGVALLVTAFSLIIPVFEPGIGTFGDALWYCFSIITTIGFGDKFALSAVGRILSVILGLYGIIMVSLITSIIVNYYGEMRRLEESGESAGEEDPKGETEE